jgi:hypothetical protein
MKPIPQKIHPVAAQSLFSSPFLNLAGVCTGTTWDTRVAATMRGRSSPSGSRRVAPALDWREG